MPAEAVNRTIRVLVTKLGLDAHDRGAKVVARAFRDAGFEVIYTGLFQRPEWVVAAAVQEDVDVVGISSLAGAHGVLVPELAAGLRAAGLDDVLIICGGIIPADDVPTLTAAGVKAVFGPGSDLDDIISYTRQNVRP